MLHFIYGGVVQKGGIEISKKQIQDSSSQPSFMKIIYLNIQILFIYFYKKIVKWGR